ncbi:MAG: type II secretion system protein GspG, partial [Lentisphaeraceae bacterium]|nr:type II secretion system protein GspG [Lentisphaeraceae bacterium]
YIDFLKQNIYVNNENYADTDATDTEVEDPYENSYRYKYDDTTDEFIIYSVDLDGDDDAGVYNPSNDEDDISSDEL